MMIADFGSDATCPISLFFTPAALGPVDGTLSTGHADRQSEWQWSGRAATFPAKCKKKRRSAQSAKKKCNRKRKR